MQNKTRNWTDVQLIISSISIALTVGLWGLLASREKGAAVAQTQATLPVEPEVTATPSDVLLPGETLFLGGVAPPSAITVVEPRRRKGDGGGGGGCGGGGGGGGAHAGTGSS